MEGSQGIQEGSRFRAFSNGVSGAAQESAGDSEHHNVGIASEAAGAYLNGRRSFPSELAVYGTSVAGSNQHFQGFSHTGSLYDEQSLASAFEDLGLKTRTDDPPTSHRNMGLTNGHYTSGHLDVTLNQQHVPATHQDDSLPLQFSEAHAQQQSDVEHQEQGYGFPPHLGNFSGTSELQSFNSNFGVPYHPSNASASPFQQQCYLDGQSQMLRPNDQNFNSNFIVPHGMGVQPYSVMPPHYACPQMQQVSGFDVYQHRSNEQAALCTPAKGPSLYIGTPDSHGLGNGYPYFNDAAFQKRNNQLYSFPSTSYTDSSCGNGDFRHFQQAEKFSHPYGQEFLHHHQTDRLAHPYGLGFSHHQTSSRFNTPSYPERIVMSHDHDVGNSVRTIKFAPLVNGYADMDHRINGYDHDHHGIQSNNPLLPFKPNDQNFSSNFILPHGMGVQPYSVMPPHYACPQMQQVSGFDVYQHRSNEQAAVCTPVKGPSLYIGTPDSHGLGNGYPYFNDAAFQKSNQLYSFPSISYTDNSCGSGDFRHFQQAEKFSHPYGLEFLHHHQTDRLAHPYGLGFSHYQTSGRFNTANYPERIVMSHDVGNSVRTINFAPSVNVYADMGHRINGYDHDHHGIQSNNSLLPLLSSKSKLTIDEVVERICILAKDQNGCHFLQKILTEGTQEDSDKVFYGIIDHIGELIVDPIAHYLVQKILETNDRRMQLISEIIKAPVELIKVCCNAHGTRVMQKVIETIKPTETSMVVTALGHGTMRLMTDANGNHVVARCLQTLLPEHKAFIIEAAAVRYVQLARDRHGCCVLQKCIEHSNDEQRNDLLKKIASAALRLSEDQYGNYVIQFILSLNNERATSKVVDELAGQFGNLSMQKCGSHVVEHCLKQAPQPICDRIINELMNDPKLPQIMLDQYGNFVIQTALKRSQGEQHAAFVEAIRPYTASLQNNMYGKRVLSRTYLKNRHCHFWQMYLQGQ